MTNEDRTFWLADHVHLDPILNQINLCPTQMERAKRTFKKGFNRADILAKLTPDGSMDTSDVMHLFWKEGDHVVNRIQDS